jgi:hypothetical protein
MRARLHSAAKSLASPPAGSQETSSPVGRGADRASRLPTSARGATSNRRPSKEAAGHRLCGSTEDSPKAGVSPACLARAQATSWDAEIDGVHARSSVNPSVAMDSSWRPLDIKRNPIFFMAPSNTPDRPDFRVGPAT